nr:MAG TPA: hypothetical protein [Caudoviricetes sp.]
MHYCVHLLTKELPSEDKIADIMKPYNSELIYGSDDEDKQIDYPVFTWDYYRIGGRYKAELKLKVDEEGSANSEYYNWGYYDRQDRNGRLFWSSLLSTLKENITPEWMYHEEDWFMNMGFGDGHILVDGAKQSDVINIDKLGCYICILPDGSAIARDSWNGKAIVKDEKFDEKYKQAITNNMDGFITVLDIHD